MTDEVARGTGGCWPMAERSSLPTVLGLPLLVAVGVAASFTALGVFGDLIGSGQLGTLFTICYVVGCLLAVVWVRRGGLFGPMVAPPLLVAVTVPIVVLLAGTPKPGAGMAEQLLVIGSPLVNAFPVMAWTTLLVLVVGIVRTVVQRPLDGPDAGPAAADEPDADLDDDDEPVSARRGSAGRSGDAAPGAGRRSGSPRRS